jgi:hypothetical protein
VPSARARRIHLWAWQFARGARGGMLTAGTLCPATRVSQTPVNVASRSRIRTRKRADPVPDADEQGLRLRGGLRTARGGVTPRMCPRRAATSVADSRYRRLRTIVSTGKKPPASRPSAGLRGQALPEAATVRGAGRPLPARRIGRTAAVLICWPGRPSSPRALRYPPAGFSRASRSTRPRRSGLARGRPGRCGQAHRRGISRRCQASTGPGVTSRSARSTPGRRRASAARTARPAPSGPGPEDPTAQHRDLRTEHHGLRVLGCLAAAGQHQPAEDPDHDQIEQAKGHQSRPCRTQPIRPNRSSQYPLRVLKRYRPCATNLIAADGGEARSGVLARISLGLPGQLPWGCGTRFLVIPGWLHRLSGERLTAQRVSDVSCRPPRPLAAARRVRLRSRSGSPR